MLLAPYYREYELPWEGDPESAARFRSILRVLLIISVLLGILFPLLPTPKHATVEDVPQRLAQVDDREQAQAAAAAAAASKPEEKPKIEPKLAMVMPPPVDQHAEGAREGAEAAEPGQG